jgi:hypothetical protein
MVLVCEHLPDLILLFIFRIFFSLAACLAGAGAAATGFKRGLVFFLVDVLLDSGEGTETLLSFDLRGLVTGCSSSSADELSIRLLRLAAAGERTMASSRADETRGRNVCAPVRLSL